MDFCTVWMYLIRVWTPQVTQQQYDYGKNSFIMINTQDLTGQKFGHLTAVRKTEERKNGYIVYECQCDCGRPDCRHIIYRSSRLLKRTQVTDCGGAAALTHARHFKDLTGKKFGMLTVLKEDGKQGRSTRWLCACDCGNRTHATTHQLLAGKKGSCGCRQNFFEIKDWAETGSHPAMKFDQLTVLRHEKYMKGTHYWRCRCSCGNETVVTQSQLLSGRVHSCGCFAVEKAKENALLFNGTSIRSIRGKAGERKPFAGSKSGIRGVYQNSRGIWIAQIFFRGRPIYLGSFKTVDEAREARERAEAEMFDKTIDEWKKAAK